nr:pro-sigmaK processing inhibitor BofA family protein [Nanoarchaeota archaeon]
MFKELLILIIVVLIILLVFNLVKKVFILIINSIIGIFALIGFNTLFHANITINFWSVIITAIGGLIGFAIVVGCHYLGWAF